MISENAFAPSDGADTTQPDAKPETAAEIFANKCFCIPERFTVGGCIFFGSVALPGYHSSTTGEWRTLPTVICEVQSDKTGAMQPGDLFALVQVERAHQEHRLAVEYLDEYREIGPEIKFCNVLLVLFDDVIFRFHTIPRSDYMVGS